MKQIIFLVLSLQITLLCYAQQPLPEDIQQRLNSLKNNAKIALDNYRTKIEKGRLYSGELRYEFSYPEYLWEKSHQYNLNLGMIYDEEMRNRMLQLMRNEFREDELDTLVNRYMARNEKWFQSDAIDSCRFDTLAIYRAASDSFFVALKEAAPDSARRAYIDSYEGFYKKQHMHDVIRLLKLDTTQICRQAYSAIVEQEREKRRKDILTKDVFYYTVLAKISGYLNDPRFVQPLIDALDKPQNFERKVVIEALVRMRVEPYYSDYVKHRTRTIEQIKSERPRFRIVDFIYVLGTQEAYLELSKYLLSDYPESYESADDKTYVSMTMSEKAFSLIRDHIENEDIQAVIKNKNAYDNPELVMPLYNWMQANYGKYKIRRLW
jgi:hypothetical protein